MKRGYIYIFLSGFISGLVVFFGPYIFSPLGSLFDSYYRFLSYALPVFNEPNSLLYFIIFFILVIPFFVVFLLLSNSKKSFGAMRTISFPIRILGFVLGFALSYGLWVFAVAIALSRGQFIFL